MRTVDTEVHERLRAVSEDTCGLSVTVQLNKSVTELPGDMFQFKYIDLRQTSILRITDTCVSGKRMRSVELPESLTEVESGFLYESQVRQLDLRHTSLQRVGDYFLNYCRNMVSVELPHCLTAIGTHFLNDECEKLERIDLRNTSIVEIPNAFACKAFSLKSIQLPDCVTEVGDHFALECSQLETLDLRNTALQRIGRFFALNCRSLTQVYLPDTVSEVGSTFLYRGGYRWSPTLSPVRIEPDHPVSVVCDSAAVKDAMAAGQ